MDIISDSVFSAHSLPRVDAKFDACILNAVELRRTLDNPDVVGQNVQGVKFTFRGLASGALKWLLRCVCSLNMAL